MLSVFEKLGYEGYVRFWQTICRWKGLKETYLTSYCLQKSTEGLKSQACLKNQAMKDMSDFGKRYAIGKVSNRPIQRAIAYKNPLRD